MLVECLMFHMVQTKAAVYSSLNSNFVLCNIHRRSKVSAIQEMRCEGEKYISNVKKSSCVERSVNSERSTLVFRVIKIYVVSYE